MILCIPIEDICIFKKIYLIEKSSAIEQTIMLEIIVKCLSAIDLLWTT